MKLSRDLEEVSRRVRVLRDRVLVAPLTYTNPYLEVVGVKINKGVVVAIGYGRRQRRKVAFHQKMDGRGAGRTTWFEDGAETGVISPMRVKVGDVVEYSFRNITVIPFDRVGFPNVGDLHFVWQNAIMTVDPQESGHESLLFAQSAGFDRDGNYLSGKEEWTRA